MAKFEFLVRRRFAVETCDSILDRTGKEPRRDTQESGDGLFQRFTTFANGKYDSRKVIRWIAIKEPDSIVLPCI